MPSSAGMQPTPATVDLRARLLRINASNIEEAQEQVRPWEVVLTPLDRGLAPLDGGLLFLDQLLLGRLHNRIPWMQRTVAPSRGVSFVFHGGPSSVARIGTTPLDRQHCLMAGADTDVNAYVSQDVVAVSINVGEEKWNDTLRAFQSDLNCSPGQTRFLPLIPDRLGAMAALMTALCSAEGTSAAVAVTSAQVGCLEDLVLSVLQSMLGTATPERSFSRARLARHRAVTRVLEYVDANLTEPLSLQRLCVAGSVAARTLEYGFHELFGVSPLKYVRLERLTRVRRALLQTPAPVASVTDAAMRWGFWHLGQFSHDYRKLFGETPSATLARGRHGSRIQT